MTNPLATTQTPGGDWVTQREFALAVTNLRAEFAMQVKYEKQIADMRVEHERELRQLTERLKNDAIEKAEASIMEKSASHNDLLRKMETQQATYVTNASMRTTILFYVSLASFGVVLLNIALRFYLPGK